MRKTTVAININACAGVYKNKTLLNFRSGGFAVDLVGIEPTLETLDTPTFYNHELPKVTS
jgi:hypothetical protein